MRRSDLPLAFPAVELAARAADKKGTAPHTTTFLKTTKENRQMTQDAVTWSRDRATAETVLALGAPLSRDLIDTIVGTSPDQAFVTNCADPALKQKRTYCALQDTPVRRAALGLMDLWDAYHLGRHSARFEAHAWYGRQVCPLVAPEDLPEGYRGRDVRSRDEDQFCYDQHPDRLEQRLWFTSANAVIVTTDIGQPSVVPITVRALSDDPAVRLRPMDLRQARQLLALP